MTFIGTDVVTAFDGSHTWTSLPKNTDRYDSLMGSIFSDQAGTLHVEQSENVVWALNSDPTKPPTFIANWDVDDQVVVTANTGAKINVTILDAFIRFRFVATTATPTVFRLSGKLVAAGDS